MKTTNLSSLQEAVIRILDTLVAGKDVALEVSVTDATTGAIGGLLTKIHQEAQRRGLAVAAEVKEGGELCLSLRRH